MGMQGKWKVAIPLVLMGLLGAACTQQSAGQRAENAAQAADTASLVTNQPLPHFNYSQIRQNLIEIETAEANGVQTTSFFFNQGVADPVQTCASIGVPIPNTMSLSNPLQAVGGPNGNGDVAVSQMDPNGTYSPASSSGTFVMCVDAQGHTYADYWEGFVQTVFGPATWNTATHSVSLVGPPSFTFSKGKGQ
jgi:hypothetical protein